MKARLVGKPGSTHLGTAAICCWWSGTGSTDPDRAAAGRHKHQRGSGRRTAGSRCCHHLTAHLRRRRTTRISFSFPLLELHLDIPAILQRQRQEATGTTREASWDCKRSCPQRNRKARAVQLPMALGCMEELRPHRSITAAGRRGHMGVAEPPCRLPLPSAPSPHHQNTRLKINEK